MKKSNCKNLNQTIDKIMKVFPGMEYTDCLKLRQKLFEAFADAAAQGKYACVFVGGHMFTAVSQGYHLNLDQVHPKEDGKPTH